MPSIIIPEGVTTIGDGLFSGCSSLASISFPNSIVSVGHSIFEETPWFENQPDGVIYVGRIAYKYKGTVSSNTSIKIKEGTNKINDSLFNNCSGLISVTIPEGVISIGDYAFYGCGLASVSIPSSVTSIGYMAFCQNWNLSTATFPNSIVSVGGYAFAGTPWLSNQPEGLIYIGKTVYAYKGSGKNENIVIKDETASISPLAFYESDIASVSFPNSIESIGFQAFYGCSNLTSIILGNNLTSIGQESFYGCRSLSLVTIHAPSLTTYGGNAFDNNANGRIIFVPAEGISEYKSNWNNYRNSIFYLGENSGSVLEYIK